MMVKLYMDYSAYFTGSVYKPVKGRAVYRIGGEKNSEGISFPNDQLIKTVWAKCASGHLEVVERWEDKENNILVTIPAGTKKKQRNAFIERFQKHCS